MVELTNEMKKSDLAMTTLNINVLFGEPIAHTAINYREVTPTQAVWSIRIRLKNGHVIETDTPETAQAVLTTIVSMLDLCGVTI